MIARFAGLTLDARSMKRAVPHERNRWLAANLLAIRNDHREPARVDPHALPWHYRLMIRILRVEWPHAAARRVMRGALGDRATGI